MVLVIVGSRSFHGQSIGVIERAVTAALKHWNYNDGQIEEIVSGGAKGIDLLAEAWAKAHRIRVKRFEADWDGEGKKAGIRRNIKMIDYAAAHPDARVIAIHDGVSPGTAHTISYAKKKGLMLFVGHPKESKR